MPKGLTWRPGHVSRFTSWLQAKGAFYLARGVVLVSYRIAQEGERVRVGDVGGTDCPMHAVSFASGAHQGGAW